MRFGGGGGRQRSLLAVRMLFLWISILTHNKDMYGEERIKEFLAANRRLPAGEQLTNLESDVERFIGDTSFDDDFTLVAARVV